MAIDAADDRLALLFNAWFLDDGVLGRKSAILHALSVIDTLGPPLSLHINLCFSAKMTSACSHQV